MRHDPAAASLVVMLRGLRMYGLSQATAALIEQGAPAFEAAIPILSQLLKAELAEREVRSIAYQTKTARFPAYKDLSGFSFADTQVNEPMVRQLHGGDFIERAENVVLIGGREPGKPTWRPRWPSRRLPITGRRRASGQRSAWSMRSNRKNRQPGRADCRPAAPSGSRDP